MHLHSAHASILHAASHYCLSETLLSLREHRRDASINQTPRWLLRLSCTRNRCGLAARNIAKPEHKGRTLRGCNAQNHPC